MLAFGTRTCTCTVATGVGLALACQPTGRKKTTENGQRESQHLGVGVGVQPLLAAERLEAVVRDLRVLVLVDLQHLSCCAVRRVNNSDRASQHIVHWVA